MPALLRVRGYRFFFFSMEGREPPHIHVGHAGRHAKFWLEPVTLADVRGFRDHELTEIRRLSSRTGNSSWRGGMNTSVENAARALAVDVSCSIHSLSVVLGDGRTISVPLAWFPRLLEATPKQRTKWELIGGGIGIHWEAIDEDISVASLLQPENFMPLPNKRIQPARGRRRARAGARGARG